MLKGPPPVSSSYTHIDCYYHPEINIHQLTTPRTKLKLLCSLNTYRSNERHAVIHGGGGGKSQREDCGFHLENTIALRKCTHHITETPPYNCKHCNVSFKGKNRQCKIRISWKFLMSLHPVWAQPFFCILQEVSLSTWDRRHMEKKPVVTQMAQIEVCCCFFLWVCLIRC